MLLSDDAVLQIINIIKNDSVDKDILMKCTYTEYYNLYRYAAYREIGNLSIWIVDRLPKCMLIHCQEFGEDTFIKIVDIEKLSKFVGNN